MLNKLQIILLSFVTVCISHGYANEREQLIQTIEKITDSHRQLSLEISNWNAEKESLLNELSILKASLKDYSENEEKLQKQIAELKEKKKELLFVLNKQEKLIKNISNFIDKNSKFLISSCEKIPKSLQFLINDDLSRLKNFAVDKNASNSDKLSSIKSLTSSIIKAQKDVHVVKEIVTLNGNMFEVDAIYLGTFTGFFRSPDSFGKIIHKNSQWSAVEEQSLKEQITKLFEQLQRKGVPKIIQLPVGGNE